MNQYDNATLLKMQKIAEDKVQYSTNMLIVVGEELAKLHHLLGQLVSENSDAFTKAGMATVIQLVGSLQALRSTIDFSGKEFNPNLQHVPSFKQVIAKLKEETPDSALEAANENWAWPVKRNDTVMYEALKNANYYVPIRYIRTWNDREWHEIGDYLYLKTNGDIDQQAAYILSHPDRELVCPPLIRCFRSYNEVKAEMERVG